MRYRVGHSVKVRSFDMTDLTLRVIDILPESGLRLNLPYPSYQENGLPYLHISKSDVLEHHGVDKVPETEDVGECVLYANLPDDIEPELPSVIDKKIMDNDEYFFQGQHIKWYYDIVDGARLETEGYILQCKFDQVKTVFICSELFCSQPSRYWVVSPYVVDYLLPFT